MPQSASEFLNEPDSPPPTPAGAAGGAPSAAQFLAKPDDIKRNPMVEAKAGDGLSFADRAALSAHDSTSERQMYLQKVYGKDAVREQKGADGKSKLFLKKDGKDIEIPDDFGFLADMAGHLPEMGGATWGAIEGGAAGALGGPVGVFAGAVIGSGVGALGGYAAKQVAKEAAGTYNKTTGEAIESGAQAYSEGALGEIGGRAVGKLVSKTLSGRIPKFFTGATDESIELTKKAWAGGALPPYASMAPAARKLSRIEIDAEKLTGRYKKQDERNQQFILSELRETMQTSGMTKPQVDELMRAISDPHAAPFTAREAGDVLKQGVQAQVQTLEHHVTQAAAASDKLIDARLSNIDRLIDAHPAGMLADDTADMIKNAKQQFSQTASGIYDKIHASLGGARVVPTEGIRAAAGQITSLLPKSILSNMVKEASALAKRNVTPEDAVLLKEFGIDVGTDKISLKDAQRIRTVLSERGGATDLTRNTVKGDHLLVARAVDDAIQEAGQDPMAAPAIAALNQADKWYKANIAKFKDTAVKKLVKDTRSGMPPDPQRVVNILASPGQSARTETLRQVLGDGVWKRVQSLHMGMVMQGVSSTGEKGSRLVDGMKLIDYLSKPENLSVFKAVHGDAQAADLKEIGQMLAARKGTMSPEILAQGDVRGALDVLRTSEKRLDDYLKGNLLAELRDPRKTGEDVFRWAVEPGKESRLFEVVRQFGEHSQQMAELRQAALEMVARNASLKAIDEHGNQALESAILEFTDTQRSLLFPNGLDKDIRKLGETIRFIYPFKSGATRDIGMAGMHAGAVLEMPLRKRLYRQAVAAVARFVVLHPVVARWIVTGRDPDTPWIYSAAQIVKQMVKMGMIDELPDQPEVERDPQKSSQQIQFAKHQGDPNDGADGPTGQGDRPAQPVAGKRAGSQAAPANH